MWIVKAMDFAYKAHANQFRKDRVSPYIMHPVEVFRQLQMWWINDEAMLCASLLHDVLEDCPCCEESKIREVFGDKITDLVVEMTYDKKVTKQEYMDSFLTKSISAYVLKIADRLVNTLDFWNSQDANNRSYAMKYLKKADVLFSKKTIIARYDAVLNCFGNDVTHRICQDVVMMQNFKPTD